MTKTIPVFKNPHLDGRSLFFKGNEIGVLLIHGFTATTVEVRQLGEYLFKKGLTVSAPLLPGHGTSPEDLNICKHQDWIDCVEQAYLELNKKCQKIIVGGESMGAVLSLLLASKYKNIKALLLYSPAIKVGKLEYSIPLKFLFPVIDKGNYNEEMPWQGYTVYPLKAAHEFFKLQRIVLSDLFKVFQPVILFQGKYDQTIGQDCGTIIINTIQSADKEIVWMNHSGHVMLLDREFELIAERTFQFLQKQKILSLSEGL